MTATLIAMSEGHGWRRFHAGPVVLWLKDQVDGMTGNTLAAHLAAAPVGSDWLEDWLKSLHGHFALVASGPGWTLAAVDRIRSTPVFFAPDERPTLVAAHAPSLADALGLGPGNIDPDGALAVAMAGYTIGGDTLYRSIRQLRPGEALLASDDWMRTIRYHVYSPWKVRTGVTATELEEQLGEVTLNILRRMISWAGGRTIAVPLSAGMDSRLIASGLFHLGYDNVRCFAYGQQGNHEAAASRAIAQRLGFPWTFVPYTHRSQRRYFRSDLHQRYMSFADSCASSPFMQDLPVLDHLLRDGWLPPDAVVVNGNSGDYISGGHIPSAALGFGSPGEKWREQFSAYAKKHLSLWGSLKTPAHLERMEARLRREMDEIGLAYGEPGGDHGVYEFLEFQDRQCKYVISGQRIYDFLELEWRLPLWDDDYLDFWQGVPVEHKLGQSLYRTMLQGRNWGSVWRDLPINRRWPSPLWLAPVRLALKALHMPLGRDRWHRFERQYLHYWMSPTCNYAAMPYWQVARDRRGHRNGIAFQNALYLADKGINQDMLLRP
jgi:asparagine synthase (glutamine-hydrolysing)